MNIFFYNSLSKKKEIFNSIKKNKVSVYICGPTTYDHLHIGNIRPMVVFDVLRRLLIYLKYDVVFVTNLTDVDDKIIKTYRNNIEERIGNRNNTSGGRSIPDIVHKKRDRLITETLAIRVCNKFVSHGI